MHLHAVWVCTQGGRWRWHMQAAQAMSAYSDWAPPQYQEEEQQAQPAASAPALTQQATDAAGTGATPVPEGQAAAENGAATSGFTYDSNSGTPLSVHGQAFLHLPKALHVSVRLCMCEDNRCLRIADVACLRRLLLRSRIWVLL